MGLRPVEIFLFLVWRRVKLELLTQYPASNDEIYLRFLKTYINGNYLYTEYGVRSSISARSLKLSDVAPG